MQTKGRTISWWPVASWIVEGLLKQTLDMGQGKGNTGYWKLQMWRMLELQQVNKDPADTELTLQSEEEHQ
ncbi:Ubiquitin Carboxyl-Terminal Hydrolase 48 [Manis pentadactyla]|nr:Ubiquitin Carboxyl-Terminal Hydrolase 48 [Manis pentadactyla]